MSETPPAVVIDIGSYTTKAGRSGDDAPKVINKSIIYKTQTEGFLHIPETIKPEQTTPVYPIKNGIVQNFQDIEVLLKGTFSDLQVEPNEQPLLLAETPLMPKAHREFLTQTSFETFNVPGFFIANQGTLVLYSCGRISGIAFDIGHGVTKSNPVFEGYPVAHASFESHVAGDVLTKSLQEMLNKNLTEKLTYDQATQIKESLCYSAVDYDVEMKKDIGTQYTLPDGRTITLKEERIKCPEILFNPSIANIEEVGVHQLIYDSIMKSDIDIRRDLINNIVLAGGSTFNNLDERLLIEIQKLFPSSFANMIRVYSEPESKYAVWLGGSIVTSLPTFTNIWISKTEYDESGPSIVHRKCF